MPAVKTILVKTDKKNWRPASFGIGLNRAYGAILIYTWDLHPGENSLEVRAVNEPGVKGPVSHIRVMRND
jgi:hypothetical protein